MFLIYCTIIGDGETVRRVRILHVQAATESEAISRVHSHFGEGYTTVVKVERVG